MRLFLAHKEGIYKDFNNKIFKSSMRKYEVGFLDIKIDGVLNDFISDKKHHSGIKKAVFANSIKNYPLWEKFLKQKLKFGYMGENILFDEICENSVFIGDIFESKDVILRVIQPRKPCAKLSAIFKNRNFTYEIFKTGLSGWYFEVLKEGILRNDDEFKIIRGDDLNLSILDVNKAFFDPKNNLEIFKKMQKSKFLNPSWIDTINKRLNNSFNDTFMKEIS